MKLADQILISREGKTYRADLQTLSSVMLLNEDYKTLLNKLDELSASIEKLTSDFNDLAYSKSEMRSTFSTIEQISGLTANALYVLSSTAKAETDKLVSKAALSAWEKTTSEESFGRLRRGYEDAIELVVADPIESDKLKDFSNWRNIEYSDVAP